MITKMAAEIAGFADFLGQLEVGRPADILVLEQRLPDPYENVVAADPSWVRLVVVGGRPVYGESAVLDQLQLGESVQQFDAVIAWGKAMKLDLRDAVPQTAGSSAGQATAGGALAPSSRLQQLRSSLIQLFPSIGPIFA
jgi:hypothetical protein